MDYKELLRLLGYDDTSLYGYRSDEEYEKRIKFLVKIISWIERNNKYCKK